MHRILLFFFVLFTTTAFAQEIDTLRKQSDTVRISGDTLLHVDTLLLVRRDTLIRKDTLTLIGVGDIMMGTNYPDDTRLPPDNGAGLMQDVQDTLSGADITFGNLEGVLLDSGGKAKSCRDPKVCYVFRSPESYVDNLLKAGFDVMSLANNHAGDFGDEGRRSSMKTLDSAGLNYAGQTSKPYTTFEKDGIRYGFTAFAPNSGCLNINDLEQAKAIVMHLDSISDVVIVSFHGGAEGAQFEHVPRKHELFYGEDRGDVYNFAHLLVDVGADVIFGHGPHVTRAVEVYKDRFIAYSLGNFCTYRGISVSGVNGLAPIIKIYTDPTGKFFHGQIIPTYQSYATGVRIDPGKQVIKKIQELTKKDFPDSVIQIDDNGIITYLAQ